MKSVKVCEYSRSSSFHDDLILIDQASGEHFQDQWSSGFIIPNHFLNKLANNNITLHKGMFYSILAKL